MNTNLLKGNILKSLLIFSIPLFISNLFQQLYNTVDTIIVGNFLGDISLAAIGASGAVFELLVGFALGIGNGLSMVVARSYGANDKDTLKRSVAGSLVIGIIVSVAIMLISKLFLYQLLEILKTPENIIKESYSYISKISMFVGIMFAYNLFAGLLRAIGNSVMPLVFLIISSLMNIILDIVFIIYLNMGIEGAAIATVISQGVSAILCLIYIYKKCHILVPKKEHFHVSKSLYKELFGQGFSMGIMLAIVCTGTVILQLAINNLGYLTIAGHVTARKLNTFCMIPLVTIALSVSTFVSQNKGANQGERIRKGIRYANILGMVWGAIVSVILFFTAPFLIKLLSGSENSTILNNGALYLRISSPFYIVLTILLNTRYSFQGLGAKFLPLISSIIEFLGKIIFSLLFVPKLGYIGVIVCEPLLWCLMTIQLVYSFYKDPYIKKFKSNKKLKFVSMKTFK